MRILSKVTLAFLLFILLVGCNSEQEQKPYLFGSGFGINNASILVEDLEDARSFFRDTLGFNFRGNTSQGALKGTLVDQATFADNTQLELVTINDSLPNRESMEPGLLRETKGMISYGLSTSSVDSVQRWLTGIAYRMDSVQSYRVSTETPDGWTRDDGSPQRKNLNFNYSSLNPYLPQFVQQTNFDYQRISKEWRTYYAYWRSFRSHPNGVIGIRALRISVSNLQGVIEEFKNMGFEVLESSAEGSRLKISDRQEIQLYYSDELAADTLNSKLEGIVFEVENLDSTFAYFSKRLPADAFEMKESPRAIQLQANHAGGVMMRFVQEPEEQGKMANMLSMRGELDESAKKHAADLYQKYCALCHGENREGYAADNAPSLRSHSLLATSQNNNFMRYTIQYGRANTAMGGYISTQGGPLEYIDIEILLKWLYDTAGVEEGIDLSREQVLGDVELGAQVYEKNCAVCHGEKGEGISAPALGNPMLLATATDHFLRYAIAEGRDGTPMVAFKETLSEEEIDGVTTFLRSRASGWDVPSLDSVTIPQPDEYILNADNKVPSFQLKEGKYLPAVQLKKAMDDSLRLVILDARSEVAWRQMHIPGSVPIPYYEDPETFVNDIPNDSTMIVVYCACPHAASQRVVNTLKREGFENTAILDEGILVWAQMGFPVRHGN